MPKGIPFLYRPAGRKQIHLHLYLSFMSANSTLPRQHSGAHFDVQAVTELKSREEAQYHYAACREKLLHISLWGTYSGEGPEVFILTDKNGDAVSRPAIVGDHVKIFLPGPHSFKADGADWVRVEQIHEERHKHLDEVLTAITLRPCGNPCVEDPTVAHFYEAQSTNTLVVCRHRTQVSASVHGRNEAVNLATDWLDCLRNLSVALPARIGLSNPHWKKLAKSLIC